MIYTLHIGLFITVFLIILNGFLRGAKKYQIDAVLSVFLIGIIITMFIVFGWKAGVLSIMLSFFYGIISRPVAANISSRSLSIDGSPSGNYVGLPPQPLERISLELGREKGPQDVMKELMNNSNRHEIAKNELLDYCLSQTTIQAILSEYGANHSTLEDLYSTLCAAGAGQWAGGHWVAASSIAYPESLYFLLSNKQGGLSLMDQAYSLIMYFERGIPLKK